MTTIDDGLKAVHRFSLRDVVLFEVYMLSAGVLFGFLFPSLVRVAPWLRAGIALLGLIFIVMVLYHKDGKHYRQRLTKGKEIYFLRTLSLFDMAIYKLAMVSAGLLLVSVWPVLREVSRERYILIVGFGMGYFIAIVSHKR